MIDGIAVVLGSDVHLVRQHVLDRLVVPAVAELELVRLHTYVVAPGRERGKKGHREGGRKDDTPSSNRQLVSRASRSLRFDQRMPPYTLATHVTSGNCYTHRSCNDKGVYDYDKSG
jgi:hypothetical protein